MTNQELEMITKIDQSIKKANNYVKENTTLTDEVEVELAAYVLYWYSVEYGNAAPFFTDNPITLSEIEKAIKVIVDLQKSRGYSIGCSSMDREAVRDALFILKGMRTPEELEYPMIGEFIINQLSK